MPCSTRSSPQDPNARVACETSTTTGVVFVFGEITTNSYVDIEKLVRETVRGIGYTHGDYGFDCDTCAVMVSLKEQSSDIKQGVDHALEEREGALTDAQLNTGAGDQGMMIGFACDETPELMPLTISLAHKLTRRLAEARKTGEIEWLRPDAKSQVTVEYAYGKPKRVDTIVISTQHAPEVDNATIRQHHHRPDYQSGRPGGTAGRATRASSSTRPGALSPVVRSATPG